MSQDFKLKFEENKESVNVDTTANSGNPDIYITPGHTRNLAFVWPDGKIEFLNYSYLVHCKYDPVTNKLNLLFTTHLVEISGQRLESLAYNLLAHIPRIIRCTDKRYNAAKGEEEPIINSISVVPVG